MNDGKLRLGAAVLAASIFVSGGDLFAQSGQPAVGQASRMAVDPQTATEKKADPAPWNRFTGEWGGGRTWLQEKAGVNIIANFVIDWVGNPFGGLCQMARESSNAFLGVNLDWSRWSRSLDGFQFQVSLIYRFGDSLSDQALGNQFQVQQDYGGHGIFLYDLWLSKSFKDGRYLLKLGRIAQGDDFLSNPLFGAYVNNAFDGNPVSIFLNSPIEAYPHSTWGIYYYMNPIDQWYLKAGVYGADTRLNLDSMHGSFMGFDFNQGAYIIAQTGYRLNKAKGDQGLSGEYSVGAYYSTATWPVQGDTQGRTVTGLWGAYLMVDQMLYREGKNSDQGLYIWMSFVTGPEDTSKMPYFVSGGLQYKGLIPTRDNDKLVLGAVWGKFSPYLAHAERMTPGGLPQDSETVIELDYLFQIAPFFYIEPNFQYIINPSGTGKIMNPLVIGLQGGINL